MSLWKRTAPFVVRRADSCARVSSRRKARGFTLVELLVVISIIGMLMALLLPAIQNAYETGRQNTCRNNLTNLAKALFMYANRNGRLPGYMNILKTQNGNSYQDPTTMTKTPVSWAVEILTDLDRGSLYEQWRKDLDGGQNGSSSSSGGTGSQQNFIVDTKQYIEIFVCPSDPATSKMGTPISYVVNTGMRDLPKALPSQSGSSSGGGAGSGGSAGGSSGTGMAGMPRDWESNGMFFDNYSEDMLINTSSQRGPMITMRLEMCRDPKDKTILLTENVDAGNYTFDSQGAGGSTFSNAEVETGCIYTVGPVTNPNNKPPTMNPTDSASQGGGSGGSGGGSGGGSSGGSKDSMRINVDPGRGDGISYDYCRPSSKHPQGINVAFVGQNVQFMRDTLAYFVFAKLMASEDARMRLPGTQTQADPVLRQYQLSDADINP